MEKSVSLKWDKSREHVGNKTCEAREHIEHLACETRGYVGQKSRATQEDMRHIWHETRKGTRAHKAQAT